MPDQPSVSHFRRWRCVLLLKSSSLIGIEILERGFDFVQTSKRQRTCLSAEDTVGHAGRPGIATLVELHDQIIDQCNGSLTLHEPYGKRILAYDNAHAFRPPRKFPDGYFKFPRLCSPKFPQAGRFNYGVVAASQVGLAAASFSR
jgi:hypothetical protein